MSNLPPAPEGALVYTHPQGKTIHVMPDGSMICYKPDGKRATTSATPDKLAAGHGGWEFVPGASGQGPTALTPAPTSTPLAYGLAPQLALEADLSALETIVCGTGYVAEQKVDGDRVLLDTTSGSLVARTRDGRIYSKSLPTAVRKHNLPTGLVIDGELVGSAYWAFDLPVAPHDLIGTDVVGAPLHVRREALEALRDAGRLGPIKVIPQARTIDEKHALVRTAVERGYEGIMAKLSDSVYRPGDRNRDWLKVKLVKTADVVVTPKKKPDGHNSVALSVYDAGRLVEVGHASLNGKEKRGAIAEGDVLEVKYLYVGANGRLYQPRILRKRTDKRPEECTTAQLHMVNKEVLEHL